MVEALAVSGFSRHFLVDSFIATVVQTLTTGMCNQRQNALRILRALSRSTNNAGALLARQQFGTGLLEAVTHENCQELRSGYDNLGIFPYVSRHQYQYNPASAR